MVWFESTYIYFHMLVQTIVHDQAVGHSNAVRFHGVAGNIGIIAHIRIVEIGSGFRAVSVQHRLVERRQRRHD